MENIFSKKSIPLLLAIVLLYACGSNPAGKSSKEDRWNIYGFFDPDQDVRINNFYDNYDPAEEKYKNEDLFWYTHVNKGNIRVDEFLEAEAVYLGQTREGIEFCTSADLKGLNAFLPSRTVVMRVPSIQNFSRNLDKYSVLKIKYRYFYRPVYAPKGQEPSSVTNRKVSQAKKSGLMGINEFFLDEYEIIGKVSVPQTQIKEGAGRVGSVLSDGLQRVGGVLSAALRGADRAIGSLLGIDDFIPQGETTLENGAAYQKAGLGEIVKKSKEYNGPDLYLSSRVTLVEDRGNNLWAFREAEGQLVQTMKFTGHIPSNMKDIRIYYRLLTGGIFEVDEYKHATIFNDQW